MEPKQLTMLVDTCGLCYPILPKPSFCGRHYWTWHSGLGGTSKSTTSFVRKPQTKLSDAYGKRRNASQLET